MHPSLLRPQKRFFKRFPCYKAFSLDFLDLMRKKQDWNSSILKLNNSLTAYIISFNFDKINSPTNSFMNLYEINSDTGDNLSGYNIWPRVQNGTKCQKLLPWHFDNLWKFSDILEFYQFSDIFVFNQFSDILKPIFWHF